ncbi:MAG: hypothetical protein IJ233_09895, partial [Pyramidobacter sp.]|nr:hypothetical protein [Pyramidobacter sp.]
RVKIAFELLLKFVFIVRISHGMTLLSPHEIPQILPLYIIARRSKRAQPVISDVLRIHPWHKKLNFRE